MTRMPDFKVKVAELALPEAGCCVGLANLNATVGNIPANRERIQRAIACFRDRGVHLAVFPELCLSGYFWEDEAGCRPYMESATLDRQRDFIDNVIRPALNESLRFVVLNLLRRATPEHQAPLVNSTMVIGRTLSGEPIEGFYDKTFLPGLEKRYLTSGGGRRLVLDTEWGRLGFLTCYDLCFPALMLGYQLIDRVDGVILTSCWRGPAHRSYPGLGLDDQGYYGRLWEILIPAQAALSQTWIFAANAVGRHAISSAVFCGGSGIWAPSGHLLIRAANDSEELLILKNIPLTPERRREQADFDYAADFEAAGLTWPSPLNKASVINGR
jgi:predicted amidohydrolase